MNIPTIDVDKVKELLDSYWKKWEPYEYPPTKTFIDLAKEDFLYRVNLYNDLIQRKDLSHFYPFRTILERLLKYESLLAFEPKKRENWLYWDITEGWKKLAKESIDNGDMESKKINSMLSQFEKIYGIESGTTYMNIKDLAAKSKILHSQHGYDIYKTACEYCHGSLFSSAMRMYGEEKYVTAEFSRLILQFLEKLGKLEKSLKTKDI